jgi:hypothetical protein
MARVRIPDNVAAVVMFRHRRTCCICNIPDRTVQIHHIDEDPSNNAIENLAVLCLECHNFTQISGGFGRKLGAAEVTLSRDDWVARVARAKEQADKLIVARMAGLPPEPVAGSGCSSSDNLRLIGHFEKGGFGSSGVEVKRPACGAASGGLR